VVDHANRFNVVVADIQRIVVGQCRLTLSNPR